MDTIECQHPDGNELDLQKKMEDENLRLQRQVRMIQADRTNRIMGVHPQFREHENLLRTLKKEYLNLVKDLKIARSGAHKKKDRKMKADLKSALLLRKKTGQDCEGGISLMEQLEHLVKMNTKNMLHLRSLAQASKGQLDERRLQSEVRLTSTENRLENATLRFNTLQFNNQKIRHEIEHMLKDRALFNQNWIKMITILTKGKKYLREMFESSSVAYDQRDEWCRKLKSLQEKANMEQTLQVQEMRDIQKAYDHEMKLFHFLAKKGVIRINKKEEEREAEQAKKEEEQLSLDIEDHRKILNEIDNFTEESNITKVIEEFKRVEVENFSKYQLLCEFCAEEEVLKNDIKRIRRDIVDRKDWNDSRDARIEGNTQKLQKKVEEQIKRTETWRAKVKDKEDLLNSTMGKISEIFKLLGCSVEPFQNLLGDKEPSLRRLNLTFCQITDEIKHLVETVFYNEHYLSKKSQLGSRLKKYTVNVKPPATWTAPCINIYVPADPCPNCIEARWMSRLSESAELPLNKQTVLQAVSDLAAEVAYERSDRIHLLVDCRLPRSRLILAKRYV